MLTMGKPIQLKCERPMGMPDEMFGERIYGNLRQMQGHFTPVDILHFLSAPPEIYLADTGMTMLVNQRNGAEIKNLELSLVNNVLNRILVSGHMMFTYQDRVFVENILKKMGVADVREWIGQVQTVKEETEVVNELLSLYKAGQDTIRQIYEYRREQAALTKVREEGEETEKAEAEALFRFSTAVQNRLQTTAVYQEVGSYAAFRFGDRTMIDRRELSFGEQNIAASYLALNDFRKRSWQNDQHMVYYLSDPYEAWEISHTDETYEQMAKHLVQSVLLQAVSQLFCIRYADFSQHTGWRHEFMDALHVSVRNTFQRWSGLAERMYLSRSKKETYHRTKQYLERREIKALKNLFEKSKELMLPTPQEMEVLQTALPDQPTAAAAYRQNADGRSVRQEKEQPPDPIPQEAAEHYVERMEEIKEWLERIDRRNLERMERLAEYESRAETSEKQQIRFDRARADVLMAPDNPQQGMTIDRASAKTGASEAQRDSGKLREILEDETVRVLKTVRGYQKDPDQYPNVTTLEGQAMNLFLRDIAAAGERQTTILEAGSETIIHDGKLRVRQKETESARPFQETVWDTPPAERGHGTKAAALETEPAVELLHRQKEQTVNEEKLRELLQTRSSDKQIQNAVFRESVSEKEQVEKMVHAKVKEITGKQDEEIARLISQNVKRQLDTLSEKVYGNLEKRMDAERRRRGL